MLPLLRIAVPLALALGVALALDLMSDARGVLPPGFRQFWRRGLATLAVTLLLAVGVFAPLGALGATDAAPDPSAISTPQLFLLHALMAATIGIWSLLASPGGGAGPAPAPAPLGMGGVGAIGAMRGRGPPSVARVPAPPPLPPPPRVSLG